MAHIDANKTTTWNIGNHGHGDPELAAAMRKLNQYPELVERHRDLMLELAERVAIAVTQNKLEALSFFNAAFSVIIRASISLVKTQNKGV